MNNLFSQIDPTFATQKGTIFCDGGSRGNPGISGGGAVLYDENQKELGRAGIFTGHQTNNFAEYSSLIVGMKLARTHNISHLTVYMDSKLAIEQMAGRWKVKHPQMKILWEKAKIIADEFKMVDFQHVRREKNTVADEIANEVMDKKTDI